MRYFVWLFLGLALVASGCGGNSAADTADSGTEPGGDVAAETANPDRTSPSDAKLDSTGFEILQEVVDFQPECIAVCADFECGDDGCGGTCGTCPDAAPLCVAGKCTVECQPDCAGKECGDDGCDGTCGECPEFHVCLEDGACLCQPQCDEDDCGEDGCGGTCGDCIYPAAQCIEGTCECYPQCEGKQCGDDGCGGICGECPPAHDCLSDGTCLCIPDCTNTDCGSDGCGGSCGSCQCGEYCINGLCEFTACDGKECGSNGCGGSCGNCQPGLACVDGLCPPEGQTCEDFNQMDWDGCTGGQLSEYLANESLDDDPKAPALAILDNGAYVVAWQSVGQDGDSEAVVARIFDPVDGKDGFEFQLNTYTNGSQRKPEVAAIPGGGIVAVWVSTGQDSFLDGVYGKVLDNAGNEQSQEFQVNLFTTMNQTDPTVVGMLGGFVVAWQSDSQDGSNTGVYAQLFNALGQKVGTEFQVNSYTLSYQNAPALTVFEEGGFGAVWSSFTQDGSDFGIIAQQYNDDGTKQWQEFQVNTYTSGQQVWADAASLGGLDYIVVWQSLGQDGDDYGIFGQRLGPPSGKKGTEFQVHSQSAQVQEFPAVGGALDGRFAVAWQSCPAAGVQEPGQDGDGCGIFAQPFKANGKSNGDELAVNVFTAAHQSLPDVAMFADGSFVIAWESCPPAPTPDVGQDGDGCGIVVRRFSASGDPLYH